MSVDLVLIILVALVVVNYRISRSVLYPPFLFCGMWLLAFSLYRMNMVETDRLHSNTLAIVAGGAVLFSFGGALGMLLPRVLIEARLVLTRFPPRNTIVKSAIIGFLLCGLPLLLWTVIQNGSQSAGPGTIFQRSRTAGVNAANAAQTSGGFSILAYLIMWSLYAAPLFLTERRDKSFWLMASIALTAGILSTGRVPILQLISSLVCVHLIKTDRQAIWPALKTSRLPILLFACLYCGLIFINKDTSVYVGGIGAVILFFFVSYIVGPVAAFDYLLQHLTDFEGASNHTFKFFLLILSHFHLIDYTPLPQYDRFVYVPFGVNVYTVYKFYVIDFGLRGALLVIALIGFLHTLLYRKARTGSELGTYFFAITVFPAVFCIFSDEYAAFGSYIDALLFASIYIALRSIPARILPRLVSGYGVRGYDRGSV
jgi:oligosaccharide repeat unit polymerase